jgi:hypothetical protein
MYCPAKKQTQRSWTFTMPKAAGKEPNSVKLKLAWINLAIRGIIDANLGRLNAKMHKLLTGITRSV